MWGDPEWNPSLSTGGGGGKKEKGQEKVYGAGVGVGRKEGRGQERGAPEGVHWFQDRLSEELRRADVLWGTASLSPTGRVFPPRPGRALHPATHLDS